MRRILYVSLLLNCLAHYAYSVDEPTITVPASQENPLPQTASIPDKAKEPVKQERKFDISLNMDIGLSSPYMNTFDVFDNLLSHLFFKKPLEFKALSINEGLSADANLFFTPVKLQFYTKNQSSMEFWINLESRFFMAVSDATLESVKEIQKKSNDPLSINLDNMKGDVEFAGYAFFETGFAYSKTILNNKIWIRSAPAVYFPLSYIKKNKLSLKGYTSSESGDGFMGVEGSGKIDMYSPYDLNSVNPLNTFSAMGADFSLNVLVSLIPPLDFGTNISHIPVIPATLRYKSSIGLDINFKIPDLTSSFWNNPANISGLVQAGDVILESDWTLDVAKITNQYIFRPVHFDFFVLYKPFNTQILTIHPSLGFSLNSVFAAWIFNYGLEVMCKLPAVFSFKAGTKYFEALYIHYLAVNLDFSNFEINLGISMQAQNFLESVTGEGLGVTLALKFGY